MSKTLPLIFNQAKSNQIRSISNPINKLTSIAKNQPFLYENTKRPLLKLNIMDIKLSRDYSLKKNKDKGVNSASKVQRPKVELRKEEINQIFDYEDYIKTLGQSLERLKQDYNDNLQLRATPSTFEQINVKVHGGNVMKLGEIAQVDTKSSNMFIIDLIKTPDMVRPVYDALIKSNLCSNPQIDKTSIYIPIPKFTREHRENMAKTAKLKCEQTVKKMHEVESKLMRKTKEAKKVSKDLIFNVSQYVSE
jgi:ribosome recycling factor